MDREPVRVLLSHFTHFLSGDNEQDHVVHMQFVRTIKNILFDSDVSRALCHLDKVVR